MFNKLLFSLIALLGTVSAFASDRTHISQIDPGNFYHDFYAPNTYTGMFSSVNEVNADSLFHLLDHGKFEAMNRTAFNSAQNTLYRYFSFWVKNISRREETLIWLMKNAVANRIVLYRRDASGISKLAETGDHFAFDNRPIPFFLFAFPSYTYEKKIQLSQCFLSI